MAIKQTWQIGDQVTVRQPVIAYYSNYGGRPELILQPETVGTVGAVKVPYVRVSSDRSRGDYFICVDYTDAGSKRIERAAVRYDNLIKHQGKTVEGD